MSGVRLAAAITALWPVLATAPAARAETVIVESDDAVLVFGGYANLLSGVRLNTVSSTSAELGLEKRVGLSQAVARLEWKLSLGEVFTAELHNRFALSVTGAGSNATTGLGIGVSRTPERWLDTSTQLVGTPSTTLEHDLDRLVVRLFLGPWDVSIGRQAISWGTSNIFSVADAWALFSPFDLDTSQKRGVDAVRVSRPLSERWAIDAIVADRGSLDDLSAGLRLSGWLNALDVFVAAAKLWEQLALMAGTAIPVAEFKLSAEIWAAWSLDDDALVLPRGTLGLDWFGQDLSLTFELHYNGAGTRDADDYLSHALASAPLARGEVYLLGRAYAAAAALWKLTEQLNLSVAVIGNLLDPSVLVTTTLVYDVAESVDLTLGAFNGAGGGGSLDEGRIDSELGAAGHLFFLQLRAFL